MTSLPIPAGWPEGRASVPVAVADAGSALHGIESRGAHPGLNPTDDEQFLLRAFRTFSHAAASLEHSYGTLRAKVERLRCELEQSHSDLARSLEENRSVREHLDRILEGLPQPEPSPVDLGQLLEWARDFFQPLARQSRVVLSLQNHLAGVFLDADRHRLEQVLLNLMLNAIRAMPGGGWIELSGRKISRPKPRNDAEHGGAVTLAVADTGPGISPEHISRIFEAGFSTRSAGPGLGLPVSRKIVEQQGGAITVASPPGRGAIFTLTFLLPAWFAGSPALSHAGSSPLSFSQPSPEGGSSR